MTQARREVLQHLGFSDDVHAGLWIDKMLPLQTHKVNKALNTNEVKTARGQHIQRLLRIKIPNAYREAFERSEEHHRHSGHTMAIASVNGRMVIGIGNKGPMEIGLTLHHTWGVPYIPGSALKGIAAATAHRLIEDDSWRGPGKDALPGESYKTLFGVLAEQGKVVFHDALWKPRGQSLPLAPDVMTVHHADYYQGDPNQPPPPSDTDSPNPISFVSATGQYLVALQGPRELCQAALTLLKIGLEELGIGTKTNAGYGRLKLEEIPWTAPTPDVWFEARYGAHTQDLSPKDAYNKVLELIDKPPTIPQDLNPQTCMHLLATALENALQHANSLADGDTDNAAAALEAQLDALKAQKPPKKDKKKLKAWKKESEKLQRRIDGAKASAKGNQRRLDEVKSVKDWLLKHTMA